MSVSSSVPTRSNVICMAATTTNATFNDTTKTNVDTNTDPAHTLIKPSVLDVPMVMEPLSSTTYSSPFITPLHTSPSSMSIRATTVNTSSAAVKVVIPLPLPLPLSSPELLVQHPQQQNQILPDSLHVLLEKGTRMLKYPNKASSRPELRLIRVSAVPLHISWESKKKVESTVDFHSILEIRMGQNTKAFEIHGKQPDLDERAFSIIYMSKGRYKSLNVVAPSPENCALWITGLHILMIQLDRTVGGQTSSRNLTNMSQWLKTLWQEADVSGIGTLDLDQVTVLMEQLNFRLSKSEIKSTFRANICRTGSIPFDAFEKLYNMLRFRPDIAEIFSETARAHSSHITPEEFENFLLNVQKIDWSLDRCRETYEKFKAPESGVMDIDHFSAFLISARNSILKKSHQAIFQDMTRPLCDYFINTSHNTYLLGDQLTGESSVEGYIRALQRGCRCVELDCWDGPAGQPVIYHGRTLTTRLLFHDAVEAISKYAFVASSYPLILSLEIHCSADQQQVIARILRDAFGESLLLAPVRNDSILPSPLDLLKKVIIKGKIGNSGKDGDEIYVGTDDDTADADVGGTPPGNANASVGMLLRGRPPLSSATLPYSSAPTRSSSVSATQGSQSTVQQSGTTIVADSTTSATSATSSSPSTANTASHAKPKVVITKALEALIVYCKGVSLHSSTLPLLPLRFDCMYSFSERTANTLIQKQREKLSLLSVSHLSRVYPSIIRITSSNMDPVPLWMCGIQMVALNFQTFDRAMHLNQALFDINGRCGYVLKPKEMFRNATLPSSTVDSTEIPLRSLDKGALYRTDFSKPILLEITIISAQQLPKPNDTVATDNISPCVEMEIIGGSNAALSTAGGVGGIGDLETNSKFRTSPVKSKMFSPVWKQRAVFTVMLPAFAFLKFVVLDTDTKISKCIGTYCIFLASLEKGYRHVPLNNMQGERLRFSTLFVHVDMHPLDTDGN
ncbi:hypothetical protein BASA50_001758 [Batrachochytrium salamandrivorans]|uniref:Phosphoinositide phospholipase C n=1 Tax=Batrachochytrium salamandrivorans TaxID=1357716 RepID=A0ABQ8FNF9_9FUNG|nr:hypothetical protein BASA50_001758 [Batrachochytrium salamandrivorans]